MFAFILGQIAFQNQNIFAPVAKISSYIIVFIMEEINKISKKYFDLLTERAKKSKVYKSFQSVGLQLAELLNDEQHKALYMRLAKNHNNEWLLDIARTISEKKNIENKGAYFMKMLKESKNK